MNKNISIKLRLKLFDAVVSPTLLFGLSTLPVHATTMEKIDIVQRKMIRKMVGWVRYDTETWKCTMHRMKLRVQQALQQHKIRSWSDRIENMKIFMPIIFFHTIFAISHYIRMNKAVKVGKLYDNSLSYVSICI